METKMTDRRRWYAGVTLYDTRTGPEQPLTQGLLRWVELPEDGPQWAQIRVTAIDKGSRGHVRVIGHPDELEHVDAIANIGPTDRIDGNAVTIWAPDGRVGIWATARCDVKVSLFTTERAEAVDAT